MYKKIHNSLSVYLLIVMCRALIRWAQTLKAKLDLVLSFYKSLWFLQHKNPTFWALLKNSSLFSKFQAQTFKKSEPKLGLGLDPSLLTHIFRSSDDLLNLFYGWTLYVISKRQFKMHTLYPRDGPKLAYNSYLWCFSNLLSKFFLKRKPVLKK